MEWLKPIMFTAGVGFMDSRHSVKGGPEEVRMCKGVGVRGLSEFWESLFPLESVYPSTRVCTRVMWMCQVDSSSTFQKIPIHLSTHSPTHPPIHPPTLACACALCLRITMASYCTATSTCTAHDVCCMAALTGYGSVQDRGARLPHRHGGRRGQLAGGGHGRRSAGL